LNDLRESQASLQEDLARRDRELEEAVDMVEALRAELEAARADTQPTVDHDALDRISSLEAREAALVAELAAAREAADTREASVDAEAQQTFDRDREALNAKVAELEAREAELLGEVDSLRRTADSVGDTIESHDDRERLLEEARMALAERERELEARIERVENRERAVDGAIVSFVDAPQHEPVVEVPETEGQVRSADETEMSLSQRIAAANAGGGDSMEAIRSAAMEALDQARAIKGQPTSGTPDVQPSGWDVREGTHDPQPINVQREPVVMDYSPSVEPKVQDDVLDDDEDDDVPAADERKSRYSRNSAKLPHIGVQPGLNSDTIANLRKQMTSDS
jgi:hypothetical protein